VAGSTVGCTAVARVGLAPFYEPVPLVDADLIADIAYRDDADAHPLKHRLDLYRPASVGWPTLVFVHGGSLTRGDKALSPGGYDVYGNIGRFFAGRGIGVAVVNYRLQPEVRWTDQVHDVATATSWVVHGVGELGGDGRVFLAGHSAGAWLAAHALLGPAADRGSALDVHDIAGFISISGSGFDLRDERTWEMFGEERKWARRFDSGVAGDDWRLSASVVPLLEGAQAAPPFLLVHTSREWPALGRQNRLLHEALLREGFESELVTLETDSHRRMVLALSREDKAVSQLVADFVAGRVPESSPLPASSSR
jgi:acetyl esterase/lipase